MTTGFLIGFVSLDSLQSCHCHPPSIDPPSCTVAMNPQPPQHSKTDPCSHPAPSGRRDGRHRGSGGGGGEDMSSALRRDRDDEPQLSLDEALRLHHEASHASQPSGLAGTLLSSGLRTLGPLPSLVPSRDLDASQFSERDRDDARRSEVTAGEILDEACRVAEEVDASLRQTRRRGGRSSPDNPDNPNRHASRRRQPPGAQ
jgi:hypothetical protein